MVQERIAPMRDHELGEVTHYRLHLNVQVAYHLITAPNSDQLDDLDINAGT